LVADEYFLVQYNLPPLLPELLPGLTENVPATEAVQELIQAIVVYYQNVYQALESERSSWIPELALDLALSLAHLPDKVWAKQRIVHSGQAWLELHGLSQPEEVEEQNLVPLLEAIESALRIEDLDYVEKLNQCLAVVGDDQRLNVTEACYNRGISRCHEEDYKAAISDFDQAIQLNPKLADAYYNRGLAYAKLEQYQEAIEDYTEALEINPNWADAYNNRGNAYYKLGNHDKAIADYNQALSINPDFTEAHRNRDIAQGVLDEIERKQQEEEERKRKLENVSLAYTLIGHTHQIFSLAFSPDGQTLASGSWD
jgi:tetratricopeptide (TPR) repeat protein